MIHFSKQKKIEYLASDIYDLVNDTDSYKYFVPFCKDSRVLSQQNNEKICELVFTKGPISRKLVTRNVLVPNEKISIFLEEGDFSRLEGIWCFKSQDKGCLVSIEFEYAFSDILIEYAFGSIFNKLTEQMIEIFRQRADEVLR